MYKSPLHIFDNSGNPEDFITDINDLKRLRQKLLAEFSISGQTQIVLGGKHYSKDDIIKTIDILMMTSDLDLHLFVYKHKNLLLFLEDELETLSPSLISNIEAPQDLHEKLEKVLFECFTEKITKALSGFDFERAELLFNYAPELSGNSKELFFESIGRKLAYYFDLVKETRDNRLHEIPEALPFIANEQFAKFINILPADFENDVYDLVSAIVNLIVAYSRMEGCSRKFVYETSLTLTRIWCEKKLMDLIRSNHRYFSTFKSSEFTTNDGENEEGEHPPDEESTETVVSTSNRQRSKNTPIVFFILFVVVGWIFVFSLEGPRGGEGGDQPTTLVYTGKPEAYKSSREYWEFYFYRQRVIDFGSDAPVNKGDEFKLAHDKLINGKSPFCNILKDTAYDTNDTNLQRVMVENRSGRDLIIFTFDTARARASFLMDGNAVTMQLAEGKNLCLCFGNNLIEGNVQEESSDILSRVMNDVYFGNIKTDAIRILKSDFTLRILKQETGKNTPLPLLKITEDFFALEEIKTKNLILQRKSVDSTQTYAPVK